MIDYYVLKAINVATSLMAGEPEKFKAGYSRENAALAVQEYFHLDEDQTNTVRRILRMREES